MQTAQHDAEARPAWPEAGPREDGVVVLDRYRLVRRLGGGGFGVVWLGHDLKLDRPVAVKRIPAGGEEVARRAKREGLAAARLAHPAIVALHETGSDEEAIYLVSELVRGDTMAQLLADGALSDRDVLEIGLVLCDALGHAHGRGVVHRDVKPQNVLVPEFADGGPVAKLTDFGVARIAGDDALTRTGDVVGTLAYMAPEQAEGGDAGPEADLYALALCLYEGLAGVNPVRARGAGATVRRIGQRLPPLGRLRRDLPLELCDAIDTAVWPHPQERGTVRALRAALHQAVGAVGDEPGTVAGTPLEPLAGVGRVAPRVATGPRLRAAAALAAAGLVGAAVAWLGRGGGTVGAVHDTAGAAADLRWWWAAAAAGAAVAVLPRLGWIISAWALVLWAAAVSGEVAWLLAAAVVPVPLLLRRGPAPAWSAPALAPLLGAIGLAGAFPALAGAVARPVGRLALGALGAWWLLLAQPLLGERLLTAVPGGHGWGALTGVVTAPALALVPVWGVAALVLPWVVRGRSIAADLVVAAVWAGVLAGATDAVLGASPRGLVAGAVVAGAAAVALAASRARPGAR